MAKTSEIYLFFDISLVSGRTFGRNPLKNSLISLNVLCHIFSLLRFVCLAILLLIVFDKLYVLFFDIV